MPHQTRRKNPTWNTIARKRPRFSRTTLDVTMHGWIYQTSAAVFRSTCFFNSLLRCKALTTIQQAFTKIWRSISKICSLHCWASTGHDFANAMHDTSHEEDIRVSLPALQIFGQTFGGEALAWKSLPPYPARRRPQQAEETKLKTFGGYKPSVRFRSSLAYMSPNSFLLGLLYNATLGVAALVGVAVFLGSDVGVPFIWR